ncbi:MAG: ATP-binding protein [Anaerolineae bacterium]
MRARYPFSAIVGQSLLKRALLLCAVRPDIGGVLVRGERGTAKSTAARALAALLPPLPAVADCSFGCDPALPPAQLCDACRQRLADGETLTAAPRPTPFVDLPVGATEDRVVGTLDIAHILERGERRFEPGLLAAANRGILYVDEVNLLDDHVVDVLLDAAAMGVNTVEREGISFSHPARFILIGTMNPEEGELRPQLTDRFGLAVDVTAVRDLDERALILERRMAFDRDPEAFAAAWAAVEAELGQAVLTARSRLDDVAVTARDLRMTAEAALTAGVDGHRGELALLKAAQANAALEGRRQLSPADLALGARLALAHRLRRGPFDDGPSDAAAMDAVVERLGKSQPWNDSEASGERPSSGPASDQPATGHQQTPARSPSPSGRPPEPSDQQQSQGGRTAPEASAGSERPVDGVDPYAVRPLAAQVEQLTRRASGRRSRSEADTRRGRYVRAEPAEGLCTDVAFDATMRAAAIRQAPLTAPATLELKAVDLQRKVRERKTGHLILFLVDASWSMAAADRITAAKGAVLSLLVDAYQRRDQVALAVFRREGTRVVLPFTGSVALARRRLKDLAVGGKTPLSHALLTADTLFRRALARDPKALPLLVLLTDGAGNVSLSGRDPEEEMRLLSARLRRRGVRSLVIDLQGGAPGFAPPGPNPAATLAAALGGELCPLKALKADGVAGQVRGRLLG